jgi:putative iron-dependent peroxidase
MSEPQPGILAPVPRLARYLSFQLAPGADPRPALEALRSAPSDGSLVLGVGLSTLHALGARVAALRELPVLSGAGISVPSTPSALWCWLRGEDRGDLVHATRALVARAAPSFALESVVDAFQYRDSRDLSGYEDGTENPQGEDAVAAAFSAGTGAGEAGSSFVAVQQWLHDLDRLAGMTQAARDAMLGRRLSDNEEIEDAPESAHVKRTAQESFDPPAFVLRRSMPWADAHREGLVFVAFGHSLDAFERLLRRMVGEEDGVVDALFRFTRPLSSASYWCPPLRGGALDLRAIGL